ncbi:MbcA/ParS/Xre antitoxin family protein [Methylophilus sp. 5]|uniref:MbcA/ParS/Xre antitoxin family protein n=1 Tax=Methylophilus sp. 5 TaxID=1112274 RepID=UPI0004BBBDDF|nr:MbcA/ParS/Xre antitoxin family protein [Methylophilus sp. 5]
MTALRATIPQQALEVDRSKITPMLLTLFDLWQLNSEEKLAALGLSLENRAALTRYKKGEAISASRDMLDRAGNLLAIHKALRLLFPQNPELAYGWMKTRNKAFHGQTPIETIVELGFPGLLYVRSYLDRARGQ